MPTFFKEGLVPCGAITPLVLYENKETFVIISRSGYAVDTYEYKPCKVHYDAHGNYTILYSNEYFLLSLSQPDEHAANTDFYWNNGGKIANFKYKEPL
jgi:hypothetical protein